MHRIPDLSISLFCVYKTPYEPIPVINCKDKATMKTSCVRSGILYALRNSPLGVNIITNLITLFNANDAHAIEIYIPVLCNISSFKNILALRRSLSTFLIMNRICPIMKIRMNAAPALYITMNKSTKFETNIAVIILFYIKNRYISLRTIIYYLLNKTCETCTAFVTVKDISI